MKKPSLKISRTAKTLPSINSKVTKKTFLGKKKLTSDLPLSQKIDLTEQSIEPETPIPLKSRKNYELKLKKLVQILKEQDEYINSLETHLTTQKKDFSKISFSKNSINATSIEFLELTLSRNEGITEFGELLKDKKSSFHYFIQQKSTSNTLKDKEIQRLKEELEKTNSTISTLTKKSEKYSRKLKNYEESRETVRTFEKVLNDLHANYDNEIKCLRVQIENKKTEVSLKMADLEELSNLLKKSEELRSFASKTKAGIEFNSEGVVRRMQELTKEKIKLEAEIKEIQNDIKSIEKVVGRLMASLDKVQDKAEMLRRKNEDLSFKYEAQKEELNRVQNKHESMKIEFQQVICDLQEALDSYERLENDEKILIRRATSGSTKLIAFDLTENELEYLQQASILIKQKLDDAKFSLEKLKKNESYLKSQIQSKELMINQMQKLTKTAETESKKLQITEENNKLKVNNLRELIQIIEEIKSNLKNINTEFKCVSCLKTCNSPYLIQPCGHMYCLDCKAGMNKLCVSCDNGIEKFVCSQELNKLFKHFRKVNESCVKMKKMLGVECL